LGNERAGSPASREIRHCDRRRGCLLSKPLPADHVAGFLAGMKLRKVASNSAPSLNKAILVRKPLQTL